MRFFIAISLFLTFISCTSQPENQDLFYTEYENNPEYSTKKMGDYFVVLTFRPKTIYNNYKEDGNKLIWRIGDNEIRIENNELIINKIKFGSVLENRIIKVDKGRVYIDGKYRKAIKK